ncbi:MAG TPA: hypothetical protein PLV25_02215, partial [Opitutales bacterium]|nr:hypothetical protein [Opitutales bacterium]
MKKRNTRVWLFGIFSAAITLASQPSVLACGEHNPAQQHNEQARKARYGIWAVQMDMVKQAWNGLGVLWDHVTGPTYSIHALYEGRYGNVKTGEEAIRAPKTKLFNRLTIEQAAAVINATLDNGFGPKAANLFMQLVNSKAFTGKQVMELVAMHIGQQTWANLQICLPESSLIEWMNDCGSDAFELGFFVSTDLMSSRIRMDYERMIQTLVSNHPDTFVQLIKAQTSSCVGAQENKSALSVEALFAHATPAIESLELRTELFRHLWSQTHRREQLALYLGQSTVCGFMLHGIVNNQEARHCIVDIKETCEPSEMSGLLEDMKSAERVKFFQTMADYDIDYLLNGDVLGMLRVVAGEMMIEDQHSMIRLLAQNIKAQLLAKQINKSRNAKRMCEQLNRSLQPTSIDNAGRAFLNDLWKTIYVPWAWPASLQSCAPDP